MKVNSPEVAAVLSGLRSSSKDKCTQIKHPEVADLLEKLLKPRPAKTPKTGTGMVINVVSDSNDSCIEEVSRETPAYNNPVESDKVQQNKADMNISKSKCINNTNDVTSSDAESDSPAGTQTENCPQSCDNIQTTTPVYVKDTSIEIDAAKTALREPGEIASGDDCDTSDTTAIVMGSLDLSDPLLDETLADYTKTNHLVDNNTN